MHLSRRDFIKATSAVAAAIGLKLPGLMTSEALAAEGALKVVWLQGQNCTGCSVSLLNSITYMTVDELLLNTIDLEYHTTVMAGAGRDAAKAAYLARARGGYVLVVEGSIPTADGGEYSELWPGLTMLKGVQEFGANCLAAIAVGTCAAYGGIPAGAGNPTGAKGLRQVLTGKPIINIPGCPMHPDWLVGTVAYMLGHGGSPPALDSQGRPTDYFGPLVHDQCQNLSRYNSDFRSRATDGHHSSSGRNCLSCHSRSDSDVRNPRTLGMSGCLYPLGCRGRVTHGDCPIRKWNGELPGTPGVNWCVGAQSPCHGCTEPNFPDGMSPFFTLNGPGV
jgi:hydrogenase small subunit